MGFLDDLLAKAKGEENAAYFQPQQPMAPPAPAPVTNPNFLDFLNSTKNTDPTQMYQAAQAANAPFRSPTDTGGGMIPSKLPELKTNETMPPAQGMGDSLMARSGDDIPKPEDDGADLNEAPTVGRDLAVDPDALRKEQAMDVALDAEPEKKPRDMQLINAQKKANNLGALMLMLKGADQIGSGLAGAKPDEGYMDAMKPLINRPVEDVMTQKQAAGQDLDQNIKNFNYSFAKDKDDPKSPSSQFYRDTLKELSEQSGIKLKMPENLSAAEMEKIYPNIINIVNAKEAREAKLMAMKAAGASKNEKLVQTLKEGMGKDLDPNQAKTGNMGKSQAMVNAADRVDALFAQYPDYNVPSIQTNELSGALAGLIGGGSAQSQHQIDTLTPSTMRGDANKIASWITGNPRGLEQQKFMKAMHETALRERSTAQNQVNLAKMQRVSKWTKLKQASPDDYEAMLLGAQLNPDDFDNRGLYIGKDPGIQAMMKNARGEGPRHVEDLKSAGVPKAGESVNKKGLTAAQEAGVANFMKVNKLSREEAIQILKDNGKL